MAKILFLAHRFPFPPNKGDKIRAYHMLRHLWARHDVWLGACADEPEDLRLLDEAIAHCEDVWSFRSTRCVALSTWRSERRRARR